MSNWVDMRLDVLASSPEEADQIEHALQNPCAKLIAASGRFAEGVEPKIVAANIKKVVAFRPVCDLGSVDPPVNQARRFEGSWVVKSWNLVNTHLLIVSNAFPDGIFLMQYWDDGDRWMKVIHAGKEIRSLYDGDRHGMGCEWVLPNIFAPFEAEYWLGLEVGSLWDEWVAGMREQIEHLAFDGHRPHPW